MSIHLEMSQRGLTPASLPHLKVSVLACVKIIISLSAAGFDCTLASGGLVWLVVLWDFFTDENLWEKLLAGWGMFLGPGAFSTTESKPQKCGR